MKILKKIWPILVVMVLLVLAYFMYAKDRIKSMLAKTVLSDAAQSEIYAILKANKSTVIEMSDEIKIVVTFESAEDAAEAAKALKIYGFAQDTADSLKYIGTIKKK